MSLIWSSSDLPAPLLQLVTAVCPHRVLVSDLPRMDTDILLDKLELHFSKRRNGGGEVDHCQMMEDSWTVAVKFMEEGGEKALGADLGPSWRRRHCTVGGR